MYTISKNGIITVNRGDNFTINTRINLGTTLYPEYYHLKAGDIVYFALMEPNQHFEHALIRKVFTMDDMDEDGYLSMSFAEEDTEYLIAGTYYYMLKLKQYEHPETTIAYAKDLTVNNQTLSGELAIEGTTLSNRFKEADHDLGYLVFTVQPKTKFILLD